MERRCRFSELCGHYPNIIKTLINELHIIPGDHNTFYKITDFQKEVSQWDSIRVKDKEVDLEELKEKYVIELPMSRVELNRLPLINFLFKHYDNNIFDEFRLAELCESVQRQYTCSCGRVVFAMPSDHGVCEICERTKHGRYSIYIGEIKNKHEAVKLCLELGI